MKIQDRLSPITHAYVAGHSIRSVVAQDEPERHRQRALSDLRYALPDAADILPEDGRIAAVVTTPDFHPGKPVPVGVVVEAEGIVMPHLIGNDIGCGMRMLVLEGVTEADLTPGLETHLRHLHFNGGRDIALTGKARHALLREGLPGLLTELSGYRQGLLRNLDRDAAWADMDRTSDAGVFNCTSIDPMFSDFADLNGDVRHDAILGTIGGGNHFVEFGRVDRIEDREFARAAGLSKDVIVLVVHSGSLDFGQAVGTFARDALCRMKQAGVDQRVLSRERRPALYRRYLDGHANAVNIAFGNRFLIGLTAVEALSRAMGKQISHRLVYDAPHNAVWANADSILHRKGACPAGGPEALDCGPYQYLGEPVILPGSMGDGSWLLRGMGNRAGLISSAHGAGRKLSRQEARTEAVVPSSLRVVGPLDLNSQALRMRVDIVKEAVSRINEEAPGAYRPIETVIDPMVDAGLVSRVAKVAPIVTVKG